MSTLQHVAKTFSQKNNSVNATVMRSQMNTITAAMKRNILIFNVLSPFLFGTAIDLYVPSLPAITNYFQTSNYLVQLSISLYMLGYASGQIFCGILSDCIGRRKVLLVSVFLFTVFSLIAAFAPNVYILNICRLLQGLAVAGVATSRAITMDCFSDLELTKAINSISISWALGPILGPFIGGYLQHYLGWQADFYFFALYGMVLFCYALLYVPETHFELLQFKPHKIMHAVGSILVNKLFLCLSLLLALVYSLTVMINVIGPFLIQVTLKYSVVAYGRIGLLLGAGYFIGNILSRFLLNYIQPKKIVFVSICGGILANVTMFLLGLLIPLNLYIVILPLFILFIFTGLVFPSSMGRVLNLTRQNAAILSAVMGTLQIGGVVVMTSLATLLPTTSQIPLAMIYVGMMLLVLWLFLLSNRLER